MLKTRYTYILLLINVAVISQSQEKVEIVKNIVPNGSFENFRKKSGNIKNAVPWQQIASVDYYQQPLSNDTTPQKGGHTGDCYTGLRFQKKYKEFLQVKLAESLHRGTTYEYEMYVRFAYWSNASLKSLGVLFTKVGYKSQGDAIKSARIDSVCKKGGFTNGYKWFKISGKYIADGGEKYLTIGNFAPKVKTDFIKMNKFKFGFKEAYYFIDDVSLVKAKEPEEKIKIEIVGTFREETDSVLEVKKDVKVGEKIALNNIFFENGHYYILPASFGELNKLAQYLIRNPAMEIRINGHSDNGGSKMKNQRLSEQRAREVFEYLIKKGVQNKMYFKGFGSQFPIASNETDIGKAQNRRVEFEIIKN